MPRARYYNSYSPNTQIGQSLQNIAAAMFASQKSPYQQEREAADVALREAQMEKATAEAEAARTATDARRNYLTNAVTAIYGGQGPEILEAHRGGGVVRRPYQADTFDETDVLPGGMATLERPAGYTPEVAANIRRLAEAGAAALAGLGNYDQISKGVQTGFQQGVEQGVLEGRVDPTRAAQAAGKAIFGVDDGVVLNRLSGELGPTTAVGQQRIATGQAQAGKYGAEAGAAAALGRERDASAGLNTARRDRLVGDKLVPVQTPEGVVHIPESELAEIYLKNVQYPKPAGEGAGPKPLRIGKTDTQNILASVDAIAGGELDGALRERIAARAGEYFVNPASEAYGNPSLAADLAFQDVLPEGVEKGGIFGLGSLRPKGAPQTSLPRVGGGGSTAPRVPPGTPLRPPGPAELPPSARSRLKEGVVTRFANGQTWTLQGGVPTRVD